MNVLTTPEGRWYEKDGQWLISVTTVIDRYLQIRPDTDEERERWAELAQRGSEIHDLLSHRVTLEEWEALPETHKNALMARQRFCDDYGFRRDGCELAMGSVALGYAGRLDDVGRIPAGRIIVDYKTGRLRYHALRLQLGAYFGLYRATYPRRKLYGAMGVGLNVANGTYAVESFSVGDMKRAHQKFMEVLRDTNQGSVGDTQTAEARQDSPWHQDEEPVWD